MGKRDKKLLSYGMEFLIWSTKQISSFQIVKKKVSLGEYKRFTQGRKMWKTEIKPKKTILKPVTRRIVSNTMTKINMYWQTIKILRAKSW